MSTVNLSDLMRELQAGEEARAKVPELQAVAHNLEVRLNSAQKHNQGLEENIVVYKQTIADLNTKVARLEVERDDAGFRELEMQDKLNTVVSRLMGVFKDVDETLAYANPPKPEPVPQPVVQDAAMPVTEPKPDATNVPITDHGAERAADPTATTDHIEYPNASSHGAFEQVNAPAVSSGQSDPHPTAPSTEAIPSSASGDAALPSAPAHSMTDQAQAYRPFGVAAGGPKPNPTDTGDYPAAKRWYNKPNDMSLEDWKASGGQP